MKIIVKCISLYFVFISLVGCHVYSGNSWDTKLKYAESDNLKKYEVTKGQFQDIYLAIQSKANNYGFMPNYEMSDDTTKALWKENKPQNALKELYGSDGRFSIGVYIIPATTIDRYVIRIFIRDYTYNEETEFYKSLNKMLENLLIDKFGFTGVKFVRAKVFILNN